MLNLIHSILIPLSVMLASCANEIVGNNQLGLVEGGQAVQDSEADEAGKPQDQQALPLKIDQLLDELEAGSKDLVGFKAKISYRKYDDLTLDTQVRSGNILYRVDPESGNKSFSLIFDRLIMNQRLDENVKHFVFDGRWLAEIDQERKQFIKRELVPPGKVLDPLKLGEGPIPLPIGQTKQDVLKLFTVESIVPPQDEKKMLSRLTPDRVDGLRLIPRPGTREADQYDHIDLFYDKQSRLPVGIDAVELNGDTKTVWLRDLVKNPEFTPQMVGRFILTNPDPSKWKIDIQPWQGPN
ncbi:MAG: hypothetical protein O7G85_05755 [Planctomycetota bacterium]|nr:hypothetical protein [Planctomycetota bacterium]